MPSRGRTPEPAAPAETAEPTNFDNLELVSPGLKNRLAITRVGSDRTEGNLLSVFAGLKNKSARPLDLEVQTLYKDKADHSLNGRNGWVPINPQAPPGDAVPLGRHHGGRDRLRGPHPPRAGKPLRLVYQSPLSS